MNDAICETRSQAPLGGFDEIIGFVRTSFQQGRTFREGEKALWQWMLKLGRSLFGAWADPLGDGDAGGCVVLKGDREVRPLDVLYRRDIQNVFGLFEFNRVVYTVDPFVRTPEDVLDALYHELPACAPRPACSSKSRHGENSTARLPP